MKGKIAIISMILLAVVLLSSFAYANFQYSGKGCKGNQICDTTNACTASGCTTTYENCESCGVTTKVCGTEVVTAPNTCSESGGTPTCVNAVVTCPAGSEASYPHVVLTFNVFTKKNLVANITPTTQTALAGTTLNYKVSLRNNNPKTLQFGLGAEAPGGWSVSMPVETSVAEGTSRDIVVRVTSNETASDGIYPIQIGIFNDELSLFGAVQADYIVASRGAPGVNTTPRTNKGYPGETIFYNVSVTNNDPSGFDASTIGLLADVPEGFEYAFNPRNLKLQPGETGYSMLEVTSPENVSEEEYGITINVSSNGLNGMDFIKYAITLCGNHICNFDEENSCTEDCPVDPYIICNGRCDRTVDDGVKFSAVVTVPFERLDVCKYEATAEACKQAADADNCGINSACLCSGTRQGSASECNLLCVDTKGVYYMYAQGADVRTIANYSFACPFVDLPDFMSMYEDFLQAQEDYEKAKSALLEVVNSPNSTMDEKAEGRTCVDGLGAIIYDLSEFNAYLKAVVDWPGIRNTTEARALADDMREDITTRYNAFCRGASGLLQIDSITAPTVEKNTTTQLDVVVKNVGNTVYNGMVSCDVTGAVGEMSTINSSCTPIGGQMYNTFQMPVPVYSAGTWSAKCRVFGSLLEECFASTLHDEKTGSFDVYTREAFIIDVSGKCTNDSITCSVRSTRGGCTSCKINDIPCRGVTTVNNTDYFECDPLPPGTYTLVGSILESTQCKPIEPAVKNTTVRCAGCGDARIDVGEQCELPYTDNSQGCIQTQSTCQGKLFGLRDATGFCRLDCSCSYDEYDYSCVAGKCNAECQDGETRVVFINKTDGICSCTQQCGSGCDWNGCDCEVGMQSRPQGLPGVAVTHIKDTETKVTLAASGENATSVEIYVDSYVVKTCNALPCSVTADYAPGVHNYYARASNQYSFVSDPLVGLKSFSVAGGNVTTSGGLNVTSVVLDVSHSPEAITEDTTVMLSAIAHGPNSFKEINIFIDGSLKKTCPNYPSSLPCTYRSNFDVGNHEYHAVAIDVKNNFARDPVAGTKSFTVTAQTSSTETTNDSVVDIGPQFLPGTEPQGPEKCSAKIVNKSCTYNDLSRRYDLFVSARWANGTHAHWEIEDNLGPKIYTYVFNHTEQLAGPGLKRIKILVHNESDENQCFVSDVIYCGQGTGGNEEVDVFYDVKDVLKIGLNDLRVVVVPYVDMDFVRIVNNFDSRANVTFLKAEGNLSETGTSSNRVQLEKTYFAYTHGTRLEAGRNVSFLYTMNTMDVGDYDIFTLVNYSDKQARFNKTVKVTVCPQSYSVLAKGPTGACRSFATSCDVPTGWSTVPSCDLETLPVQQGEDNTLLMILVVILVVVAAVLGYRYREKIKERLSRIRRRRNVEEPISMDFEA